MASISPEYPSSSTQLASLKVLIVDDNILNLRVMKQLLKTKLSHFLDLDALQTASSGQEALELLDNHVYHLLFLDISMPGISGLEVQLYRSVSMDGVIGKPLKNTDLEFALRACLESTLYQQHPDPRLKPAFYFLRHGSRQALPDLPINPFSDSIRHAESFHSSSSTITSADTLVSSSLGLPSLLTDFSSPSTSNIRQQSVVSSISPTAILAYQEIPHLLQIPLPCYDPLELVDETLLPECSRPSFDSFDNISTSDSIITCSSSGPNSAAAIDSLNPSYGLDDDEFFDQAKCLDAFPTAPIVTSTHVPLSLRSPRRWSSPLYTLSSPKTDTRLNREESDVFAAGFQAAMDHIAIQQACSRWDQNCRSATSSCSHTYQEKPSSTVTPRNMTSWSEGEEGEQGETSDKTLDRERWARLAGPTSGDDPNLPSVTRQLISRRSHPMLRLQYCDRTQSNSSHQSTSAELELACSLETPFMRKSKSAAGLPIRPSWQLVQLSTINYQSVLKAGTLLDEVLLGLDLEEHHSIP
ncbi:hypothetical protein VP01_2324g5 [Puccinia sorghi]|uniref:histidine kinase n=1 Tax=Puccinia sorghi TaxID=27349 RepID=A0A0L6V7M9_9BASI|nr:hypothetical protein VP01_2324g5 [Puccinia sorghi]